MILYMEESEIMGKFRRADNKKAMVQILAELNACSKEQMKEYLLAHGAEEKDFYAKRGRKPKNKAAEPKEKPVTVPAKAEKEVELPVKPEPEVKEPVVSLIVLEGNKEGQEKGAAESEKPVQSQQSIKDAQETIVPTKEPAESIPVLEDSKEERHKGAAGSERLVQPQQSFEDAPETVVPTEKPADVVKAEKPVSASIVIPPSVRDACFEKAKSLRDQIAALQAEYDSILDFLIQNWTPTQ